MSENKCPFCNGEFQAFFLTIKDKPEKVQIEEALNWVEKANDFDTLSSSGAFNRLRLILGMFNQ